MLDVEEGNPNEGFQVWPGLMRLNEATNSTPVIPVRPGNTSDQPTVSAFPWQSNFFIQADGDHHSLVLNTTACQYYEGYKTIYYPGAGVGTSYLTMYNNTEVNLAQPFVRPSTGGLSTATGIPLGMLAVRPEELTAGVINHALGWNAISGSLNGAGNAPCVNPAGVVRCTDGSTYQGPNNDTPMPYGSYARLQKKFDISGFPPDAQTIATAMKTYGMYIYDTGCCNVIIVENDQYGTPMWTSSDIEALGTITPADLDILSPPTNGENSNATHSRKRAHP